MRPSGPVPGTWPMSRPISRAKRRTEGAAGTGAPEVEVEVAAGTTGAGGEGAAVFSGEPASVAGGALGSGEALVAGGAGGVCGDCGAVSPGFGSAGASGGRPFGLRLFFRFRGGGLAGGLAGLAGVPRRPACAFPHPFFIHQDRSAYLGRRTVLHEDFRHHPAESRRHLQVGLVGLDLQDGLVFFDLIPDLDQDTHHGTLVDVFTQRR